MKSAVVAPNMQRVIRVLIVDDEPLFTEMLQALLQGEEGIDVVGTAQHGRQAVDLANELDPDLIVMDVSMPVMDGIDATREIRKQNPTATILILTGGASITEIDQARIAGAAAYLTKDRIGDELVAAIRGLGAK
jgi:two-component system, NarL family, nitrate/nitrite response regulator NarL